MEVACPAAHQPLSRAFSTCYNEASWGVSGSSTLLGKYKPWAEAGGRLTPNSCLAADSEGTAGMLAGVPSLLILWHVIATDKVHAGKFMFLNTIEFSNNFIIFAQVCSFVLGQICSYAWLHAAYWLWVAHSWMACLLSAGIIDMCNSAKPSDKDFRHLFLSCSW